MWNQAVPDLATTRNGYIWSRLNPIDVVVRWLAGVSDPSKIGFAS
jgi:hypothetical protein